MTDREDFLNIFVNDVLTPVADPKCEAPQSVFGFLAMEGHAFQPERALMVVGRAPNRWNGPIELAALRGEHRRRGFAREVEASVTRLKGDDCPMMWVYDRRTGRRKKCVAEDIAFWRVIGALAGKLGIGSPAAGDWPSHLVWSNLYKIVPESGKNPGTGLQKCQLPGCKRLLLREIEIFRPRRILFITDWGWARDFLLDLANPGTGLEVDGAPGNLVERSGLLQYKGHTAHCVVAARPDLRDKKREDEHEKKWVDAVAQGLQRLELHV